MERLLEEESKEAWSSIMRKRYGKDFEASVAIEAMIGKKAFQEFALQFKSHRR